MQHYKSIMDRSSKSCTSYSNFSIRLAGFPNKELWFNRFDKAGCVLIKTLAGDCERVQKARISNSKAHSISMVLFCSIEKYTK